ncbi:hypothetical protein EVAR_9519_1 [Eumeta japonica]|uniref:Uncharacterized protein n=1 Tax=Eumeta variegata TaxID=151549 RepID=A0A4C1U3V9_EUMVA|nr:hypothetical protein EVAR_9519_1 [Eumeta japonica]
MTFKIIGKLHLSKEYEEFEAYEVVPPDGGWGWLVVAASFMCNVLVDGIIFSGGMLQPSIQKEFEYGQAPILMFPHLIVDVAYNKSVVSSYSVHIYFVVPGIVIKQTLRCKGTIDNTRVVSDEKVQKGLCSTCAAPPLGIRWFQSRVSPKLDPKRTEVVRIFDGVAVRPRPPPRARGPSEWNDRVWRTAGKTGNKYLSFQCSASYLQFCRLVTRIRFAAAAAVGARAADDARAAH